LQVLKTDQNLQFPPEYILALVEREAAGADDCWTHDILGDWQEIIAGNIKCDCSK